MNKLFNEIKTRDNQFVMQTYAPFDISFVSGKGSVLTDTEGKQYIDFLAGIAVNSLGYSHPAMVNAIKEHADKYFLSSNYFYNEARGKLAKLLTDGNEKRVFFSSSGAEANECAIKLTRKYFYERGGKRFKFITADNSFHGRTLAAISATGQPKYNLPFAPLPYGFGTYVPFNDINALEQALADPEVGALMMEPIQGEGGVLPATQQYLTACREITKRNGQLLILDEVQTGAARTGKFFAYEHYNIQPDIVCAAKGIGGGLPIGACIANNDVAEAFKVGDHGSTFGGSAFICHVAHAVVNELKQPAFLTSVIENGTYLQNRLNEIKLPMVESVKGMGLMLGMKLSENTSAKNIVNAMLQKGFILNACGGNTLRFVPPLIITKNEIDLMITALRATLQNN
jgi:predicted acetylornithine/succinylornithine family transaminase